MQPNNQNPQVEFQSFSPTYGYQPALVRKRKNPIPKVIFAFLFIGVMTLLSFIGLKILSPAQSSARIISPLAEDQPTPTIQNQPEVTSEKDMGLSALVENILRDKEGTYSVFIKNLKTKEEFRLNENRQFESASLYKLWVMAVTFDQIKNGKLKEDQILSSEISTLNEKFKISSEAAELTEGSISLSVEKALEQMITISHNYAALLLSSKVRLTNMSEFIKDTGMGSSKVGSPPKTTANDIGLFYEKLYEGHIVDEEYSQKMIDLLSRQKLNDRIPKYLPQGTQVAHKTGELGRVKHDAGIVFSPNGDFIFVVLSETKSPADAAENTALLSKDVFEYFQNKKIKS